MAYLSRNDLETIAAHITGDYQKLPRFAGQPASRVDPEILAGELCQLSLNWFHLSKNGRVLGLTAYSGFSIAVYTRDWERTSCFLDGRTILVECSLKDSPEQQGRYHFTVMHEAAHQILHRMFSSTGDELNTRLVCYRGEPQRFPVRDWTEWQANVLASALLMPINLVWTALQSVGLEHGIDILNRLYRPKEYKQFCSAAELLGVSKQALAIRLKSVGLLKQDFLQEPFAFADVFPDKNEPYAGGPNHVNQSNPETA